MKDVIVIGGGLAGLTTSILLNRQGLAVTLLEKKSYPFHRVCGEYISNEVAPFLKQIRLYPEHTSVITRLLVTSPSGERLTQQLDMGGFGISRYAFDLFLSDIAKAEGVEVREKTTVENVLFEEEQFFVTLKGGEQLQSKIVVGAFGKRSTLDKQLNRSFMLERSPYMGVKYHIKTDFPKDLIALHNFQGGYCGISQVENDVFNLCYLSEKKPLKKYGSIQEMENSILHENLHLKEVFQNADFLFEKPEVINEISFSPKKCVENHLLMVGDTSGLITPLCGNGMAMAIHGATLLSRLIIKFYKLQKFDREGLENTYTKQWEKTFNLRLKVGRTLQNVFGDKRMTNLAIKTLKKFPSVTQKLIKQTHGEQFQALASEIPL